MIISIDYDDTFTKDKQLWEWFIKKAQSRGHEVICITKRYESMSEDIKSEMKIKTFFALKSKLETATNNGFKIDVWIDDKPQSIFPFRLLNKKFNKSFRGVAGPFSAFF